MRTNIVSALFAFTLLVFAGIACSAVSDGKPAAEKAIADFHAMLDQEKYADIYAAADPELKKSATEEEMITLLTAIHTKLGNVTSSKNKTWQANSYNLTSSIEMVQDTQFEHGKGSEEFVFYYADKKVSLAGYHINSMDLLSK